MVDDAVLSLILFSEVAFGGAMHASLHIQLSISLSTALPPPPPLHLLLPLLIHPLTHSPHTPGNKRSSSSSTPSSSSKDNSEFRFGSHDSTTPYSHPAPLGSGSTGGAGYGNKTGEMGGPTPDSAVGRIVEKVGGVVRSQRVVGVGRGMREREGYGRDEDDEGEERVAN